jgi:hypothetical protein
MKAAQTIENELKWFGEVLDTRLKLYFAQEPAYSSVYDVPLPELADDAYGQVVGRFNLSFAERLLLVMTLAPVLQPNLFDTLMIRNANTDQRFVEFGGTKGTHYGGFIPTLETFFFLLAADSIEDRLKAMDVFNPDHFMFRENLVMLDAVPAIEPYHSAPVSIPQDTLGLLLFGKADKPVYSQSFPAKQVTTKQKWEDLVLEQAVLKQIEEINAWVKHGHVLYHDLGLENMMTPGHRCLFYGPPGTGKTMTAALLGKANDMDVYRVDLSKIVSKYIGETEKNLSRIFDQAEHRGWILFFDEADALFGKRTAVKDAHDRFANQEVSFLLQRVEDYNGLVILASNFKSNIDDAFARRFQSVIHFPMPKVDERVKLWQKMLSHKLQLDAKVDIHAIAARYELSGGSIVNVLRYCSLMALKHGTGTIMLADIMEGIKREYNKEGKAM